ncbi:lysophospholipid acyltransferase family protein [Pedobacter sp. ASV12]|uniref:lysophospholipid acyltransferase family protein n=1 Tax=Pedobacter sp. ASV12 TaxID=2795120 RepID=UPI0018EDDE78|nr:lysophospholipid acyltransferase family protein [Pedobacter sp. ASV12]
MFRRALNHIGIFFLNLLSLLPMPILYGLAKAMYFLLYRVTGYRLSVVRENLQLALPERSPEERRLIEKKFYKYLAALVVEIVKMSSISKRELEKRFRIKRSELMESYFAKGEGVLLCAAHYGNWEWGSVAIGLAVSGQNYPIYKPLNNPVFDNWFQKARSRFGSKLISMRQTLRAIQASKGEASIFCFGSDQAPSRDESHYWTTLLHQESSIQLGIEKIARKTNRPIFYFNVTAVQEGYYEAEFVPLCLNPQETAEFEITEMHTRFLEKMIRKEPAYWLWSHRRWKHKKPVDGV